MTHDANKALTIAYNFLNLPHQFTTNEGTMTVGYDATGVKWRKTTTENGTTETLFYIDGIEYKSTTEPIAIMHEAGRYVFEPDGGGYYEYVLRDHLGNTRVVFADQNTDNIPEPMQENHYYPFGLQMENTAFVQQQQPANFYTYSGKEFNADLGIEWSDFGARWQDPTVGRWWSVDPLAERYAIYSGYSFVANSPVIFEEIDGADFDLSYLKGWNNQRALYMFLQTKEGYSFFSQFASKGQSINFNFDNKIQTVTFTEEGTMSNDLLVISTTTAQTMVVEGVMRVYSPGKGIYRYGSQIKDDPSYDVSQKVIIDIQLWQNYPSPKALNILMHEAFVHGLQETRRWTGIRQKMKAKQLKLGTDSYKKAVRVVGNSARVDHIRLGTGRATEYKNASEQIDMLYKTIIMMGQYKEDVQQHPRA